MAPIVSFRCAWIRSWTHRWTASSGMLRTVRESGVPFYFVAVGTDLNPSAVIPAHLLDQAMPNLRQLRLGWSNSLKRFRRQAPQNRSSSEVIRSSSIEAVANRIHFEEKLATDGIRSTSPELKTMQEGAAAGRHCLTVEKKLATVTRMTRISFSESVSSV